MRKFKLINANGIEWDLMRKDAFFHAPAGLGVDRTFETIRAGYDFIETESELSQKFISGEIVFRGYDIYTQFVSFVSKDPVTLCYAPSQKWYRITCKISTMDKGDMSGPVLIVPITFICFGTWRENVTIQRADVSTNAAKKYPYIYNYGYAETASGSIVIRNGDIESPCRLHIFGPVTNPAWLVYKGGVLQMSGKVQVTIPSGNKLVVDAVPSSMQIAEYTRDNVFVNDKYQNSDFSTSRFVYIPPGESTISFTHDGTSDITAFVEVERLAYTV